MTIGTTDVSRSSYGTTPDGTEIDVFQLSTPSLDVKIITYGARVIAMEAPDGNGIRGNVALGYENLAGYLTDKSYFGALVGRFANRLAKGTFQLGGQSFHVTPNNGENALHGGPISFAQRVWKGEIIPGGVEMTLVSADGDMGFPGTLSVVCRYTVEGASLHIDIQASTEAETIVNLTNHSYFNLSGEGNGTILQHEVTLDADQFVPVNAVQIPTGELRQVEGTPFDFRTPHVVGERIDTPGDEQLEGAGGYDHTYVLNGIAGALRRVAHVFDPTTRRTLTVETTQPGAQFYTGNSLTGTTIGSNGKIIERRGGLCIETQHFPDSPNQSSFPSTVLKPGELFHETTVYRFGVQQ